MNLRAEKLLIAACTAAFLSFTYAPAQTLNERGAPIVSSAMTENMGYRFLERLTNEAGGRVTGTRGYERALEILVEEGRKAGVNVELEAISVPGWRRGDDRIKLLSPHERDIRCAVLGFVDAAPSFDADVFDAGAGRNSNYNSAVAGRIALVDQDGGLYRFEAIDTAAAHGAIAVLFINSKKGGKLALGTGNFRAEKCKIPAFTVTYEDGMLLRRIMKSGLDARLRVECNSKCLGDVKTSNAVVHLPGKTSEKIVIGAHLDSWDIGQGAVDNGFGSAILFELARIFSKYQKDNDRGIDFVWFAGEETGLLGSKEYAKQHGGENISAMINMDMTGIPNGINLMGFEDFRAYFEPLAESLKSSGFNRGVVSNAWINSDHTFFMLEGIPSFVFESILEDEMTDYYHDYGDTFDKAQARHIASGAATIGLFLREMANSKDLPKIRKSHAEINDLLRKNKQEDRMRRQGWWRD
ncbi:MAG: M28 family peptidase [Chloroflexota bacterium]